MNKKIQNIKIEKEIKKMKNEAMKAVIYHRGYF